MGSQVSYNKLAVTVDLASSETKEIKNEIQYFKNEVHVNEEPLDPQEELSQQPHLLSARRIVNPKYRATRRSQPWSRPSSTKPTLMNVRVPISESSSPLHGKRHIKQILTVRGNCNLLNGNFIFVNFDE